MFAKNILIIDFESTSIDPAKAEPTQLAAILLDKENLAELGSYSSFIKADLKDADPQSMAVSGIDSAKLENAPDQKEAANQLVNHFGFDLFLASWIEHLDRRMLQKIMRAADINPMQYDYHYLDLWPIAYTYLVQRGYKGGIRSEEIFQAFGMRGRAHHDALEDCRLEAEIFRKIVFNNFNS